VQIPLHVIFVRILYRIYDYIRLILEIITKNDDFYEKNSLIYIEIVINFKKNSISCINMYVFWTLYKFSDKIMRKLSCD